VTILAFETSCDETSAAVVRDGRVLANLVSSQITVHAEYGGVVPELATREHLRNLIPVAQAALRAAEVEAGELDAVAATQGPGLPPALMIGLKAAQAMAFALERPFLGIHHHEAHLYSPWITAVSHAPRTNPDFSRGTHHADFTAFQPNVSLIVSGGHTMLVHVEDVLRHQLLGSTLDDAAGECFDKTAKLLGLPYPGGPLIDQLAAEGDPMAHDFPRPLLKELNDDFSFSGLKTSVRYFLRDNPGIVEDRQRLCDLCASIQAAIVDVLVGKTMRATASGGVTCNRGLRHALQEACDQRGLTLRLADPALCTDNAAMIAILAERKILQGAIPAALDADPLPGWVLAAT
jgi:N6-L-threonylcarbamoyladenine synthase